MNPAASPKAPAPASEKSIAHLGAYVPIPILEPTVLLGRESD